MSDSGSEGLQVKTCVKCGVEKPLVAFKTNGYNKDGTRHRMVTCRLCMGSVSGSGGVKLDVNKALNILEKILDLAKV